MKTAKVDGETISPDAVHFELERLARFYVSHGIPEEEIRKSAKELSAKALEQAIGAKLLLAEAMRLDMPVSAADVDAEIDRVVSQIGGRDAFEQALAAQGMTEAGFRKELEKGVKVNKLVEKACSGADEPTEEAVAAFYEAHRKDYAPRTLVDAHDDIKDLLRHESRGRAMDSYVAELREKASIEYIDVPVHEHGGHGGCSCGCHRHHH